MSHKKVREPSEARWGWLDGRHIVRVVHTCSFLIVLKVHTKGFVFRDKHCISKFAKKLIREMTAVSLMPGWDPYLPKHGHCPCGLAILSKRCNSL